MACAWGGVAGYGTAMVLSYLVGQKKYPIAYPMKDMTEYIMVSVVVYAIMECVQVQNMWLDLALNTLLIVVFVAFVVKKEKLLFGKIINRLNGKKFSKTKTC